MDSHVTMSADSITIRPLATVEDFQHAEEVQRGAWNLSGDRSIVPLNIMLAIQKYGGLAAGAFDAQNQMLGFVLGFLGFTGSGRIKHCSHMLGVTPDARQHNIGYRLKVFQRHYVLKQDLDLITWTFDPLEGINARLNIGKLGCITRKYHYNFYGEWSDGINRGLATDRFEVEWWIRSERVETRLTGEGTEYHTIEQTLGQGAQKALAVNLDHRGLPMPQEIPYETDGRSLLVEIPVSFQAVKAESLELAKLWRHKTAVLFSSLFGQGYVVLDFVRDTDGRCSAYVLAPLPSQLPGKE